MKKAMFILAILVGCNSTQVKMETEKVSLRQEWFPYAGFSGEVLASKLFAKSNGIELKVIPGSENLDPVKLVLSGEADFGVVGGDLLIEAVAKGAPIKAIGVINSSTPSCFITKKDSNIDGLEDFYGKTVGVMVGTNTERVYHALMKKNGLDRKKVNEQEVPFDLQTFILGEYDVRPAFIYDETVSLDLQGIEYNVIKPSDYGVEFIGTVYFTRDDMIQEKSDVVKKVVKSLQQGWISACSDPNLAIDTLVAQFPDLDKRRELRSLEKAIDLFYGPEKKPLFANQKIWESTISELVNIGVIKDGEVTVEQVWDEKFIKEVSK